MERLAYTMIVETARDESGPYYGAYFPDLPGCGTTGRTLEDVRRNAAEALQTHIHALQATGQPVPPPTTTAERIYVEEAS